MNVLKHRFNSPKTDGADPTQVQPSHWNDGHAFTGGSPTALLLRDPTDPTFGAKWSGPFVEHPFNAADFRGVAPLVWTLGAGALISNRYLRHGNVLFWALYISWFSGGNVLSGAPGAGIQVRLPGGQTPGGLGYHVVPYCQGITGVSTVAGLTLAPSGDGPWMDIRKENGTNFATTDIPGMIATFVLECQ